jgi:hypothetical protein
MAGSITASRRSRPNAERQGEVKKSLWASRGELDQTLVMKESSQGGDKNQPVFALWSGGGGYARLKVCGGGTENA